MRPLLLILTLGLALAACGGDDFGTRIDRATADLQRAGSARSENAMMRAIDGGDGSAAAARLEAKAKLLERAADELPASGVPDEAKHPLALAVDGLRKYAASLRKAAAAAHAGDLRTTARILSAFVRSASFAELSKGFDELAALH